MYYIKRYQTGVNGTFSRWFDEDGETQLCVTVERPKTGDHPCIEPGVYTFNAFQSPSKGPVWLRDDKAADDGRDMIEIHVANWARELKGCIAPGGEVAVMDGVLGVTSSGKTFTYLQGILPDTFEVTISEEWE